jgi:hypothetical protein
MAVPTTGHLLAAVALRHRLARLARLAFAAFVACAAGYAALLLAARLTGLIPDLLTPATLAIPALLALACAVVVAGVGRRTPPAAIARLVDRRLGSDDLFLTAQSIAGSAGEYQQLVLARAAARAKDARAAAIVPFAPWLRAAIATGIVAALAAGVLLLPRLDPFGREAERARLAKRQQQLALAQQAARARVAALAQERTDQPLSNAVAQQLAKLTATFDSLKRDQQAPNAQKLNAEQQALGKALAKARESQPFAPPEDPATDLQRLGAGDLAKAEALKQELAKGESRAAQQQLDQLKQLADRLAASGDPATRQQLRAELKQRLDALAGALGRQGAGASQALRQAMDQLAQSGSQGLNKQALDALKDSLDLAKAELSAVAQGTRDQAQLQEALQTLQMARQLNELGDLGASGEDGAGQGHKGLADYKRMYAELMRKHGAGEGGTGKGGMGPKPGQGDGGKGRENDAATTLFDPQRSRSQLTAGQTLMQWKTNGPADKGVAQEDYQRSLREVQQGVSEALLHEQLPPGYQEAVKKYFDTLDPGTGPPPAK